MIESLLDACEFILNDQGEPQSSFWLASQIVEMKLWRASKADVWDALKKDIAEQGESSRFVQCADDEFALRSWEKPPKQINPLPFASVEADLFVAILGFHNKTMTLLRQSSLDDEKLNIVGDRIKTLLDSATVAVKATSQVNINEWLEAAYDEARRLVDQLSGIPDGRKEK